VEPRRHVEGFGLLTMDEAGGIGRLANQLGAVLRSMLGAEHVYVFALGGLPETERTPGHLHVHVLPRYPGTPAAYRGATMTRWPDAPRVDEGEMRTLVTELRGGLPAKLNRMAPRRRARVTCAATSTGDGSRRGDTPEPPLLYG
jgi:histidine triad (HIT) family protein